MSELKLILDLMHSQDEKREIQVKGIQKAMDAGFNTLGDEMRSMKELDKVRNGRIEGLEDDVDQIERDIWVPRWMEALQMEPLRPIVIVFGLAFVYHKMDTRKTMEKILPIVFERSDTIPD